MCRWKIRRGQLVVDAFDVQLAIITDVGFVTRDREYQVHEAANLPVRHAYVKRPHNA
jgi:hypothetical protein